MTTTTPQDIDKARELINTWRSGGIDSVATALAAERSRLQVECERRLTEACCKHVIKLSANSIGILARALAQPATAEKAE